MCRPIVRVWNVGMQAVLWIMQTIIVTYASSGTFLGTEGLHFFGFLFTDFLLSCPDWLQYTPPAGGGPRAVSFLLRFAQRPRDLSSLRADYFTSTGTGTGLGDTTIFTSTRSPGLHSSLTR